MEPTAPVGGNHNLPLYADDVVLSRSDPETVKYTHFGFSTLWEMLLVIPTDGRRVLSQIKLKSCFYFKTTSGHGKRLGINVFPASMHSFQT